MSCRKFENLLRCGYYSALEKNLGTYQFTNYAVSLLLKVNEARNDLFTRKSRAIDAIPPTDDALNLHLKRSIYQGSFVWGQIMEQIQSLPSAADWGWKMGERTWEPLYLQRLKRAVN